MKKIIILLVVLLLSVSIWFAVDHFNLTNKLAKEVSSFNQTQDQNTKQSIDTIKFQTCASLADEVYNTTGKYYSVISCVNKTPQN